MAQSEYDPHAVAAITGVWDSNQPETIVQQIMTRLTSGYNLSDYVQRRMFHRSLSPTDAIIYKAVTLFNDAAKTTATNHLIDQNAIHYIDEDLRRASSTIDFSHLNANALVLAYAFIVKYNACVSTKRWNDWKRFTSDLASFGESLQTTSSTKNKEGEYGITLTPVRMFDILRYARFICTYLRPGCNLLQLDKRNRVSLIPSSREEQKEACSPYSESIDNPIILPAAQDIKCVVKGFNNNDIEVTLPLYQYDTVKTLHVRLCSHLKLPFVFLQHKETTYVGELLENRESFGNTTILFSEREWTYNILEDSILTFDSIFAYVDDVTAQANAPNSNILILISQLFNEIEKNEKPLFINKEAFMLLCALRKQNISISSLDDAKVDMEALFSNLKYSSISIVKTCMAMTKKDAFMRQCALWKNALLKVKGDSLSFQQTCSLYSVLSNSSNDLSFMPMKQIDYRISGTFKLPRTDVFQLFDKLQVDEITPFATVGQFVKAINNVNIPSSWMAEGDDEDKETVEQASVFKREQFTYYICMYDSPLIHHVNDRMIYGNEKQFVKITIMEDMSAGSETQFSYEIIINDESRERHVLQLFAESISPAPTLVYAKRSFAGGITISNNMTMCISTFYDFCLNNRFVRDTIKIQERGIINKLKQVVDQTTGAVKWSGFIRFKIMLSEGSSVFMSATLKYTMSERGGALEKQYFNIPSGQAVWSLVLSGSLTTTQASQLIDKFLKALLLMNENSGSFFNDYYCHQVTHLDQFIKEHTISVQSKDHALTALDLFVPGYNRRCDAPPDAIPFDESEYQARNRQNKEVVKFPFDNPKYILSCDAKSDKPHFGLMKNTTLSNKKMYPYIPCCYKTTNTDLLEQIKKNPSFEQLQEWEDGKSTKASKTIITTDKMLGNMVVGEIRGTWKKMLLVLDDDEKRPVLTDQYTYYRVGFNGSPHSLYDAVKWATAGLQRDRDTNTQERLRTLAASGLTYSSGLLPTIASSVAVNRGEYMNPFQFVRVMETLFEVNIVMFTQDRETNPDGIIGCEAYERMRIIDANVKYDSTVLLFVHRGGEFDGLDAPVVECIVKCEAGKASDAIKHGQRLFPTSSKMIQELIYMRDHIYPTKKVSWVCPFVGARLTKQQVDSYGYTRLCHYDWNGRKVMCFTEAIPNLIAQKQRSRSPPHDDIDYKTAYDVLSKASDDNVAYAVVYHQTETNERIVYGCHGTIGGVGTFVLTDPIAYDEALGEMFDTDRFGYPAPIPKHNLSFSEKYANFVKIANCLTSYALWLFSRYIREHDAIFTAKDHVDAWFDEHVVKNVDPRRTYNAMSLTRDLTMTNTVMMSEDGKLMIRGKTEIECEEIKQRCKYTVEQYCVYKFEELVDYADLQYIPNYYVSSSEFEMDSSWTVYNSLVEYNNMTEGLRNVYRVFESLQRQNVSYFVKLFSLETKADVDIHLAIPVHSIEDALLMYVHYASKGNIDVPKDLELTDEEVEVYSSQAALYDVNLHMISEEAEEEPLVKIGRMEDGETERFFLLVPYTAMDS